MTPNPLWSLLVRQAGVLSLAQAHQIGLSAWRLDHLIRTGVLLRVYPTVYRHAAVPPTPEAGVRAAALWQGPPAALTTQSAAWWWGLTEDCPDTWHLVTSATTHLRRQPGVRVSRAFVDPYDLTTHRGVRTISRPLATLRGAAYLEGRQPGSGHALVADVLHRKLVLRPELAEALRRNAGTWGTRMMRRLVDRVSDRAHSALEQLASRLLRAAGITGFRINFRTVLDSGRPVEFDLVFVERRVVIELDGFAFHSSPEAHRNDLQRQNDILADGWTLRRFGWRDLTEDPEGFVSTVHALLT